jgi:hypothetical protein
MKRKDIIQQRKERLYKISYNGKHTFVKALNKEEALHKIGLTCSLLSMKKVKVELWR